MMQNSMVCVDASFIVRLLVPDNFSREAQALWTKWLQAEIEIIAPTLILFETSATFRHLVYHKRIAPEDADGIFSDFNFMKIHTFHDVPLRDRAWQLAKRFNQSRTYDMNYVALAERHSCPF